MARARNADPLTSHAAAMQVEVKGKAAQDRAACLIVVVNTPGLTAAEIAVKAGQERHTPSRRLPELRAMGLVRNNGTRMCRITGNSSMTWWPIEHQSEFPFAGTGES